MNAWWKSRAFRVIAGLLLTVVLIVFGLKIWLASEVGRGVIEARLSAAMGRPIQLAGDFSLDVLPLPGAAGTDLRIYSRDGNEVALQAGEYLARLELWPLFKGQVEVVELQATNGSLDLEILASGDSTSGRSGGAFDGMPAIQNFRMSNVRVFFRGMDSDPYLNVTEFYLRALRLDEQAKFRSRLRLVSANEDLANMTLAGQLVPRSDDVLHIKLTALAIAYEDWLIEDLAGEVSAEIHESDLHLNLGWSDGQQQFGITAHIDWLPGYPEGQEGFAIHRLEVRFNDHAIAGQGCLLRTDLPRLDLELQAPTIKLGDIKSITDTWRSSVAAPVDAVETEIELPIELAVRLVIDRASYGDTRAEGIRFTSGSPPDCPKTP